MSSPALLTRRQWCGVLALLVLVEAVVAVPFLVSHPGFLREEWDFVDRTQRLGSWAAGDDLTGQYRPFVRLIYAGTYGPLVAHQGFFVVLPLLSVAIAVAFVGLLQRWVGSRLAVVAAAIWLILPTHFTLDHWAAAGNIALAVLLGLLALWILAARRSSVALLSAGIVAGVGVLAYEATVPALLVMCGAIVARRFPREPKRVLWFLAGLVPFVGIAGWLSVGPRSKVLASPIASLYFNFGVIPWMSAFAFSAMVTVLVVAASAARRSAKPRLLIVVGMVVWLLGYLPFATSGYDTMFFGVGDRANAISSLGVALVLAALVQRAYATVSVARPVLMGFAIVASIVVLGAHGVQSYAWARTTADVRAVGNCLYLRSISSHEVRLRESSAFLAKRVVAVDAYGELSGYLRTRAAKAPLQIITVSAASGEPAYDAAELLHHPAKSLHSLGC